MYGWVVAVSRDGTGVLTIMHGEILCWSHVFAREGRSAPSWSCSMLLLLLVAVVRVWMYTFSLLVVCHVEDTRKEGDIHRRQKETHHREIKARTQREDA